MIFSFSDITQALANLRAQKTRTLLTALGIVFGVCSVIAMLAIGEGASFAVENWAAAGFWKELILGLEKIKAADDAAVAAAAQAAKEKAKKS